ncbi:MAG: DUF2190 family protein [Puniceicoccales bacterium]|jgi:hypothetical protein|nr:DUF2190 family protein [Puniceicoccales bacterium]
MTHLILSNSAVGTHAGNVTKLAEEAVATKYLLGKFGTEESNVAICNGADFPVGIITDEAGAPATDGAKETVNVALLGGSDTLLAVASGAISAGSIIIPSDGGKVRALPAATASDATYGVIGFALTSASSDGQLIEFASCIQRQHVVEGLE